MRGGSGWGCQVGVVRVDANVNVIFLEGGSGRGRGSLWGRVGVSG